MTDRAPTLSILVISWNCWSDLRRCLASVYASAIDDFEVIVIENASSDGTPELLEQEFPQARVVRNDVNLGHTGGFNQGVWHTRGRWVLLLDADTEFGPTVVPSLLDFVRSEPRASVACPRLYYADGKLQETARNFPSAASGLFGRQSWLTRKFPGNPFSRRYLLRDKLEENGPYRVQSVSAACIIFERRLIDDVGTWDASYPGYWVDVDWCFRLHEKGEEIFCVPDLRVIHHESNRHGIKRGARRIWMFNYGAYLLYRKHYTAGVWDPRAVFAWLMLTLRTLLQIVHESVRFGLLGSFSRSASESPSGQ